jgi:hypothetical protein
MMKNIWCWFESTKHSMLYKFSVKYREALHLIELQEEKLYKLTLTIAEQEELLEELRGISPFKGGKNWLATERKKWSAKND